MPNSPDAIINLSQNYEELRTPVRALCSKYPGEYWRAKDIAREYPTEFVDELTSSGFLAAMIPECYGGSGLGVGAGVAESLLSFFLNKLANGFFIILCNKI